MGQRHSSTPSVLAEFFDLVQYAGTWHEIARFPLPWETLCVNATAKYTLGETPGTLLVENTCIMADGTSYSRRGVASLPENSKRKDHFKLVFTDGLPSSQMAQYWVLDTDYTNYALVGNEKRDQLWILARRPAMSHCLYSALVTLLRTTFHYDTSKLVVHLNTITPCIE